MKIRKDVILAILITFCFTVSLFLVIPIRSADNKYDPMLDYYHEGRIGLDDLVALANSYGTTGDPTLNVSVTNMDTTLYLGSINATGNQVTGVEWVLVNSSDGYGKMSILVLLKDWSDTAYNITLWIVRIDWGLSWFPDMSSEYFSVNTTFDPRAGAWYPPQPLLVETKGPYFAVWFRATTTAPDPSQVWATFDVYAYLKNN
jgi:hypothetical protein